jgi:hypothetical protein
VLLRCAPDMPRQGLVRIGRSLTSSLVALALLPMPHRYRLRRGTVVSNTDEFLANNQRYASSFSVRGFVFDVPTGKLREID